MKMKTCKKLLLSLRKSSNAWYNNNTITNIYGKDSKAVDYPIEERTEGLALKDDETIFEELLTQTLKMIPQRKGCQEGYSSSSIQLKVLILCL